MATKAEKRRRRRGRQSSDSSQTFVKTVDVDDEVEEQSLDSEFSRRSSLSDLIAQQITNIVKGSNDNSTKSQKRASTSKSVSESCDADADAIALKVAELILPAITTVVEKAVATVHSLLKSVQSKENDNEKLKSGILMNRYENDRLEQYTRRENIRIYGLAEEDGEDLVKKVCDLGAAVNADLLPSDISVVHRSGAKKPNPGRKPRPVICRFVNRNVKISLMREKRKLKDNVRYKNIFIAEDLTLLRAKLLHTVKEVPGVKDAHTKEGKIHCTDKNGKHIVVDCPDDLFLLGVDSIDYKRLGLESYTAH